MRELLTIALLALSLPSIAQHQPEKILFESRCAPFEYHKDSISTRATFNGKLKRYFERELNFRDFDVIEGVIVVQVAVDSLGHPCANNFYNFTTNTSEEINHLRIAAIIKRMPQWKPAMGGERLVNSYVMLAIYGKVDRHGQFDIDYLRNDKDRVWRVPTRNEPIVMGYGTVLDD